MTSQRLHATAKTLCPLTNTRSLPAKTQTSNATTKCRTKQSAKNTIPANLVALSFRTPNAVGPSPSLSSRRKASRARVAILAFTALVSTAARLPARLQWLRRLRALQDTAPVYHRLMIRPAPKAQQKQPLLRVKSRSPRILRHIHRLQASKVLLPLHPVQQLLRRQRPPMIPPQMLRRALQLLQSLCRATT